MKFIKNHANVHIFQAIWRIFPIYFEQQLHFLRLLATQRHTTP